MPYNRMGIVNFYIFATDLGAQKQLFNLIQDPRSPDLKFLQLFIIWHT